MRSRSRRRKGQIRYPNFKNTWLLTFLSGTCTSIKSGGVKLIVWALIWPLTWCGHASVFHLWIKCITSHINNYTNLNLRSTAFEDQNYSLCFDPGLEPTIYSIQGGYANIHTDRDFNLRSTAFKEGTLTFTPIGTWTYDLQHSRRAR
jgi:hypothetical protein